MKVDLEKMLEAIDNAAFALANQAVSGGATVADITAAALAVHAAGALRERVGASSPKDDAVRGEYLTGLHLRLLEIDDGDDIAARAAAAAISGKPVELD